MPGVFLFAYMQKFLVQGLSAARSRGNRFGSIGHQPTQAGQRLPKEELMHALVEAFMQQAAALFG
jgi:hypothetical protein